MKEYSQVEKIVGPVRCEIKFTDGEGKVSILEGQVENYTIKFKSGMDFGDERFHYRPLTTVEIVMHERAMRVIKLWQQKEHNEEE